MFNAVPPSRTCQTLPQPAGTFQTNLQNLPTPSGTLQNQISKASSFQVPPESSRTLENLPLESSRPFGTPEPFKRSKTSQICLEHSGTFWIPPDPFKSTCRTFEELCSNLPNRSGTSGTLLVPPDTHLLQWADNLGKCSTAICLTAVDVCCQIVSCVVLVLAWCKHKQTDRTFGNPGCARVPACPSPPPTYMGGDQKNLYCSLCVTAHELRA